MMMKLELENYTERLYVECPGRRGRRVERAGAIIMAHQCVARLYISSRSHLLTSGTICVKIGNHNFSFKELYSAPSHVPHTVLIIA